MKSIDLGRGQISQYHKSWNSLFDSTIHDLQKDFENYQPQIKGNVAYFTCEKRIGANEWKLCKIGIPSKIWWRFLYKPKTTFVTYKMIY